jgi:hypothetical protein
MSYCSPESATIHSFSFPLGPSGHHDAMSAQAVHDAPQGDHDALALQGNHNALALQSDQDAIGPSHAYKDCYRHLASRNHPFYVVFLLLRPYGHCCNLMLSLRVFGAESHLV